MAACDKVFMDSVHGCVAMPPLCVRIIDTPEFQRLRYVKQLGIGYFVYPGASHNRFEHCIGVSHLAGKLVEALALGQEDLNISSSDILCIKVAGLCHDLGHGPFSHLWDQFMKQCKKSHHEALILGDKDTQGTGRGKDKCFLYDVVNNVRNGIDVDKWDYLQRDSHHLGIPITFSYERLIRCVKVMEVGGSGRQICYREKVAGDVLDMFSVRYELHKKAYQHRVCHKLDRMLLDAFVKADPYFSVKVVGDDGVLRRFSLSECESDMTAFSMLTDDVMQRILWEPLETLNNAKSIIKDMYCRQLYEDVGQVVLPENSPENAETMTKKMYHYLNTLEHCEVSEEAKQCLKVSEVKLGYGSKGSYPLEKVMFYSKKNNLVTCDELPDGICPSRYTCSYLHVLSTSREERILCVLHEAFDYAREELRLKEVRNCIVQMRLL